MQPCIGAYVSYSLPEEASVAILVSSLKKLLNLFIVIR